MVAASRANCRRPRAVFGSEMMTPSPWGISAAHGGPAVLEVDVYPPEAAGLAAAHAGHDEDPPEGSEAALGLGRRHVDLDEQLVQLRLALLLRGEYRTWSRAGALRSRLARRRTWAGLQRSALDPDPALELPGTAAQGRHRRCTLRSRRARRCGGGHALIPRPLSKSSVGASRW